MRRYDVSSLKAQIDCRDLIERDLGKAKYRSPNRSSYKCPLHNEQKGFSLVVYADHWHCMGKCGRGGDAISWLQEYHRLSFQEACERLARLALIVETGQPAPSLKEEARTSFHPPEQSANPPDENWQAAARKIANDAMETLWDHEGKSAWTYLQEARGLSENTIVDARLGYIPGGPTEWKTIEGLNVPCGITIPWLTKGAIWGIKVRRLAGDIRYQQVGGGNISGALYLGDEIQPGLPILLTEGEFDALIARQVGAGLISAAAIGSASNRRIDPRWYGKFLSAPSILIRMDDDPAGQGAAAQIRMLSQAARCVQVPVGKDVTEFFLLAGHEALRAWIEEVSRLKPSPPTFSP